MNNLIEKVAANIIATVLSEYRPEYDHVNKDVALYLVDLFFGHGLYDNSDSEFTKEIQEYIRTSINVNLTFDESVNHFTLNMTITVGTDVISYNTTCNFANIYSEKKNEYSVM